MPRLIGTVASFNDSTGTGRIVPDEDPELTLFVHWTQCPGNTLAPSARVEFDLVVADVPEAHGVTLSTPRAGLLRGR